MNVMMRLSKNRSIAYVNGLKYTSSSKLSRRRTLKVTKVKIAFIASAAFALWIFVFNFMKGAAKPMDGLHIGKRVVYSEDWGVYDMWEALKCDEIFEHERPVHSQIAWDNSRELYKGIVGKNSSIIEDSRNGFLVPVEVKQVPPKGRGIFASRDIRRGELIWSTQKTARFQDGPSYRKFIFGLEDGMVCDVLTCSYVQDVGDSDLRVSVDLDEGCFCNNEGNGTDANMGCDEETKINNEVYCKTHYFALEGIKAGDEIICEYGSFTSSGGWASFGL